MHRVQWSQSHGNEILFSPFMLYLSSRPRKFYHNSRSKKGIAKTIQKNPYLLHRFVYNFIHCSLLSINSGNPSCKVRKEKRKLFRLFTDQGKGLGEGKERHAKGKEKE